MEPSTPASSIPLSDFVKVLGHYHDPSREHPYYHLPAREAVYFMLTGQDNDYAINWQKENGPSHGYRLKLFTRNGTAALPAAIDT